MVLVANLKWYVMTLDSYSICCDFWVHKTVSFSGTNRRKEGLADLMTKALKKQHLVLKCFVRYSYIPFSVFHNTLFHAFYVWLLLEYHRCWLVVRIIFCGLALLTITANITTSAQQSQSLTAWAWCETRHMNQKHLSTIQFNRCYWFDM